MNKGWQFDWKPSETEAPGEIADHSGFRFEAHPSGHFTVWMDEHLMDEGYAKYRGLNKAKNAAENWLSWVRYALAMKNPLPRSLTGGNTAQ